MLYRVRGFMHFAGKTLEEVRDAAKSTNAERINYKFFNSLIRVDPETSNEVQINEPGIFISGTIELDKSEEDKEIKADEKVVKIYRTFLGLEKVVGCDVSSTREHEFKQSPDYIIPVTCAYGLKNALVYKGVRILPTSSHYPDIEKLKHISQELGRYLGVNDVTLRGVEEIVHEGEKMSKWCIDLMATHEPLLDKNNLTHENIDSFLEIHGLEVEGHSTIGLFH